MVGDVERRGGLSMRRSVHEVHQAARASRGRSGAPKVRVRTRLPCGFWPAGRQLTWLRGGLQWGVEVDFGTGVAMLCGQLASCRLIRPWRSRWSKCSVFLLALSCRRMVGTGGPKSDRRLGSGPAGRPIAGTGCRSATTGSQYR